MDKRWISQGCLELSKFTIRLLRHDDSFRREDDAGVIFESWQKKSYVNVFRTRQIEVWIPFFRKVEDRRKGFSTCWTLILPNISCDVRLSIRERSTIWINPESRLATLEEFTNMQWIGTIWSSLWEGLQFCIRDPTQSLFATHNLRLVLRKWFSWRLERNLLQSGPITKVTTSHNHVESVSFTSGSV